MPMNPEFKAEWVKRLTEEGRNQGKGVLKSEQGAQCCLDIANEIAVDLGFQPPPALVKDPVSEAPCYGYPTSKSSTQRETPGYEIYYLTTLTMAASGIEDKNPFVNTHDGPVRLAELNDIDGWNFEEIAKAIEEDETL